METITSNTAAPSVDVPRLVPPCDCRDWCRDGRDMMSLHHQRCQHYTPPPATVKASKPITAPRYGIRGNIMTTPSQDFGEPWKEQEVSFLPGTVEDRDGKVVSNREHKLRAIACVNACSGLTDPAAEIQAMRDMKMGLCRLTTQETDSKIQEAKALHEYIDELKASLPTDDTIYHGIERLKIENETMRAEIKLASIALDMADDEIHPPELNCSCHISPPCNDCVDNSQAREASDFIKRALAKLQPFAKP